MLSVEPLSCLHDEDVVITAKGFKPLEMITFSAHFLDHRGKKYSSFAHYRACEKGFIDLRTDQSFGGTYTGILPMGLIGGLAPAPNENKYLRLFKKNVEEPSEIEIRIYRGVLHIKEIFLSENDPISIIKHFRHYMGPGVRRIVIEGAKVQGNVFLPSGKGPFPGVIDMFGTAGGLLEYRAAQFASRGIAAFALAFMDYKDLPAYPVELDIRYFEEAAKILLEFNEVCQPYIGVVGVSKGGELALSIATFVPQVKFAISINGSISNTGMLLRLNDSKVMPSLGFDFSKFEMVDGEYAVMRDLADDPELKPETIIPIHLSDSKFMFIVGLDDLNWRTKEFADIAAKLCRSHGRTNYVCHFYEGAGHLIEPPYSPYCRASYHKVLDMAVLWGGSLKPHMEAQSDSWQKMIKFIKDNVNYDLSSKL